MPDAEAMWALLRPRSIAVVGASPKSRMGVAVLENSRKVGFTGSIMPVNPNYQEIGGFSCYPSLTALPEKPDCAVILVPARAVKAVLEEAGGLGVEHVVDEALGQDRLVVAWLVHLA